MRGKVNRSVIFELCPITAKTYNSKGMRMRYAFLFKAIFTEAFFQCRRPLSSLSRPLLGFNGGQQTMAII